MDTILKDNKATKGYKEWGLDTQFYIVIKGIEVFVQNINTKVDMDIVDRAKETKQEQGYYIRYASTYNPKNPSNPRTLSPIGETENKLRRIKEMKPIYQWNDEPGIWHFHGNHEAYSGCFHYIIWDKAIVEQIQNILKIKKIEQYKR